MYTLNQVKNFQLFKQKLINPSDTPFSETHFFELLQLLGYIQLDSINVTAARSQDIVLWSRLNHYPRNGYTKYYETNAVAEVYLHALSLLPTNSPIIAAWHRANLANLWQDPDNKYYFEVYDKLLATGPIYKRQFVQNKKLAQWHLSKKDKAINRLWRAGLITIKRDSRFSKIIEPTTTPIPMQSTDKEAALDELYANLITLTFNNLGIATKKESADYFHLKKRRFERIFAQLQAAARISTIAVQDTATYYILTSDIPELDQDMLPQPDSISLLSPFDNLIRDRKRTLKLFGIDYKLESYVPPEKRVFGYYALLILVGNNIVGTIDLKFDKALNKLTTRQLLWQDNTADNAAYNTLLTEKLAAFTKFVTM